MARLNNIKTKLGEMGYEDVNWIKLTQNRVQWRAFVKAAMNFRVPEKQEIH
jgi:hypothetical protein